MPISIEGELLREKERVREKEDAGLGLGAVRFFRINISKGILISGSISGKTF